MTKFLSEVRAAIAEAEKRELADMRDVKAAPLGTKSEVTTIHQWDKFYFPEKIRKARFAIDQEAIRKYFPMPATLDWAMLVASRLYGIKFQRAEVPVWHPDVQYYDVLDAKTGRFLSGIYLDLYPRDGKYKHAAAFGVRSVSRIANRTPVSVLVTNFNRKGSRTGRVYDRGPFFSRQHLYADFDMAMTGANPGDPVSVWNAMKAARPLGHDDPASRSERTKPSL